MPMPHRTFAQVATSPTGKEGSERVRTINICWELPDYRNGPCGPAEVAERGA
jgi:hypothetical protein